MDKRILFLLPAAALIAGLCIFKATRNPRPQVTTGSTPLVEPAPLFELYDQSYPSHLVRLEAFMGRQRVFVVFFDGPAGAHQSSALKRLRADYTRLRKADVYVLAISTALPQENRKIIAQHGDFPFPLLSDPDLRVHRLWGRIDATTGKPLAGVFLVDRKGAVNWSPVSNTPQPPADWQSVLQNVLKGA
jgi:peroxiredoxin